MRRRLRIISVLLIAVFLLTSVLYLIWDNNKSSFEPIEIDKDFLQKISDRLPMPEERTEVSRFVYSFKRRAFSRFCVESLLFFYR